jgi:predicted enzyme related to lactoylglutathione lyase
MAQAASAVLNRPVWVDLSAKDPEAARSFYAKLFGWDIQVSEDPQYGGYGRAKVDGQDAAGIGGTQAPDQPSVWTLYIGSDDADALSQRVAAAGGTVAVPAFDVGDQGRMAIFQDPSGAFISTWQATTMGGFQAHGPGTVGWAELNARGLDKALPFYEQVFGWTPKQVGTDEQPYTEFQLEGHSIAGASEMSSAFQAQVPSHWLVYFNVDIVDVAFQNAVASGGRELVGPMDFPGGRMAIVSDPEGASFGLLTMAPR